MIKLFIPMIGASLVSTTALAFDTLPHMEITERGLEAAGYGTRAIHRVQISNYQVDWASNKCAEAAGVLCFSPFTPNHSIARRARLLHFDELPHHEMLMAEYRWVIGALRAQAHTAEAELQALYGAHGQLPPDDPLVVEITGPLLDATGIVLHALQDLYTHSNLVDSPLGQLIGRDADVLTALDTSLTSAPAIGRMHGAIQGRTGLQTGRVSATLRTEVDDMPVGFDFMGLYQPSNPCDLAGVDPAMCIRWSGHGESTSDCNPGDPGECSSHNHDQVKRPRHLAALSVAIDETYQIAMLLDRWAPMAAAAARQMPHRRWVKQCRRRAVTSSMFAGHFSWAYEDHSALARIFRMLADYECSDSWEHERWPEVLEDLTDGHGDNAGYPDDLCATGAIPIARDPQCSILDACSTVQQGLGGCQEQWLALSCAQRQVDDVDGYPEGFPQWSEDTWNGARTCHFGDGVGPGDDDRWLGDWQFMLDGHTESVAIQKGAGPYPFFAQVSGRPFAGLADDDELQLFERDGMGQLVLRAVDTEHNGSPVTALVGWGHVDLGVAVGIYAIPDTP